MLEPLEAAHADCLRDESRAGGHADYIAHPRSEADILAILAEARQRQLPLTIQGARTGITAGAVPRGGIILNLSRMDAIHIEGHLLRVQPGATLAAIREALPPNRFFPPDPTETTASIGGMIACNASGALSFRYGPIRPHVRSLRVATADGHIHDLHRQRDRADGPRARLGTLEFELPALPRPAVKNAAGYHAEPGMDLLDLFIGAEGTLGIILEATLDLLPAPGAVWGLMAFLPDTAAAVGYVNALRAAPPGDPARPAAIEYFDARCLDFLRARSDLLATRDIAIPPMPPGAACIYAEWHAASETEAEAAVLAAAEELPRFQADPDTAILADTPAELEKLKLFRHAAPELVNSTIDERRKTHPGLVKLGTDMAVPDARLGDILDLYESDLTASGLEWLIFGHIGDNHLHVNILPRTPADYQSGKDLYARWAAQVIAWGGSISAEHGIGKLKRDLFSQMAGPETLARTRRIKKQLDPQTLLNPGNLLANP